MFWGGFFVGVVFLVVASCLTFAAWKILQNYIGDEVKERLGECPGPSKFSVELLELDVKYLKESRDKAIDYRQEIRDNIVDIELTVAEHEEAIDKLERAAETEVEVERLDGRIDSEGLTRHTRDLEFDKRLKELQDRIDYFIGVSPVGGMLAAKITQDGMAVHKATEKGAPFDRVAKRGDLVTIYEVKYVNDIQWAKIGENEWICGGWRPRDPKKDASTG